MFNEIKLDRPATSQSTSSPESSQRRRFPRLFLSHRENQLSPLSGVLLSLPDRTYLPVLGISSAGVMISPTGILSKIRLGQVLECKLKFARSPILQTVPVRLRVIRLTALVASLVIDTLNFEDRLKLEQAFRDQLIFNNIRSQELIALPLSFREAQWWVAPFDTNFLLWKNKTDSSLAFGKAIIEYDGVILTVESLGAAAPDKWNWNLKRSVPTVDEARGYASPWLEAEGQKISMGASWRARLIRLLEDSSSRDELQVFIDILSQV